MDPILKDILTENRQAAHENASALATQGDLLRIIVERQDQLIELLTPKEKDGPSLDELLGHMAGQLNELTGYARQIVKILGGLEQNLPGDAARAVAALLSATTTATASGTGNGRGNRA